MFPPKIFQGVLTKNESGDWFHCGAPVKYSMCSSCPDGCFVTHCWDWDCGWEFPDCEREETFENAALVLEVLNHG